MKSAMLLAWAALETSARGVFAGGEAELVPPLDSAQVYNLMQPAHIQALRHRIDYEPGSFTDVYNTTVQIQTRDGVNLNTYLFLPAEQPTDKIPVMIERTPYGAVNLAGAAAGWVARGYAYMGQDFRGRFFSTGNFSFWRKCADDMQDTVDWIVKQPWSNGKVATMGGSADGIAQYVQPREPQPHIVSQFVVVASAQVHRTGFQQGAYRESLFSGWLTAIGEPDYVPVVEAQEAYSEDYWGPVEVTGHFENVQWPAVHVGGWWDIFQQQNIDAFEAYRTQSNVSVQDQQYLVMLPGGHCGGGAVKWPNKTFGDSWATSLANAMADAAAMPVPPANSRTTGKNLLPRPLEDIPRLTWYVMGPGELGTRGNYWTSGSDWPTAVPTKYFLSGSDKLTTQPAGLDAPSVFVFDPLLPVPTLGGGNLLLPKCGPQDQSNLEERIDVLKFTSEPLESHVAVTGRITVTLFVSSNQTDTDFVVKVTDVYPSLDQQGGKGKGDAKSMLVQDGIVRMRWRNGPMATQPADPLVPNEIVNVTVSLGPTSYIFNPLHRIRVTVTSSNFPRFSVNPNTGKPLTDGSPAELAINAVYHDAVHQSFLELPVVDLEAMPEM